MQAVRYHEYGDPDVLRLEPAPEPHAGSGNIRIRTRAVSVNPIDWKLRRGDARHSVPLRFPVIPGRDAMGVVDEVGDGVDGVGPGEAVFGLGGVSDTYAEHAVLTAWARPPVSWTAAQAASAGLASATALRALIELARGARWPLSAAATTSGREGPSEHPLGRALTAQFSGRTILIEGAAGAVGNAAAAFARASDAQVIGTAGLRDHQFLSEMGVIPVPYGPGLGARVSQATSAMIDGVIDTAASGSLSALVRIAGSPRRVVTVADAARAEGLGVRHVWAENDSQLLEYAAWLGRLDLYDPRVALVLSLSDVVEAHTLAERGGVGGKIALTTWDGVRS